MNEPRSHLRLYRTADHLRTYRTADHVRPYRTANQLRLYRTADHRPTDDHDVPCGLSAAEDRH